MAKCKKCGDTNNYMMNKGVCGVCREKFIKDRTDNWQQVVDEFGQPTAQTLPKMKKRMRDLDGGKI